jgi:long-chain acyl-CoA synthetase
MIHENFIKYYENSLKANWELPALSDYNGITYSYGDVATIIAKQHILLKELGVKKGDKISLFGKNSANWCISFLATVTYGAVAVPILADFKTEEAINIINHSDSVLLYVDDSNLEEMEETQMKDLITVLSLEKFKVSAAKPTKQIKEVDDTFEEMFAAAYPEGYKATDIKYDELDNKELVEINYTSGTTGFSKGVMISANSLAGNVKFARENMELNHGDKMLGVLPLAHCYGCAFDFLFPLSKGVHLTILGKIPAVPVLLKAFAEIQPHLILFIPLFFEKIYKNKLLPAISKGPMSVLIKIPGINNVLYGVMKKKLMASFGGRFREAVLGGAGLAADAEKFFKKMKFPFTIGYGMTECGPLIAYDGWRTSRLGSSGKIMDIMELKIDSPDPYNEIGEILVKGENVMNGYYKNVEATNAAIDKEGWLHTGDLGVTDPEGYIYIKGRSKSMLLSSSGQNIYPEEIEAKLNNLPYVNETVVLMNDDQKLEALVNPDMAAVKTDGVEDSLAEKMEENRKAINKELKGFEAILKMHIHEEEFIKTPKRSIKRFKYSLDDVKK